MLRATLKSLLARKVRLLLTAIAVVLGVAFVSGTFILSDTMTRTFDRLFGEIYQDVDLAVRQHTGFETDNGQGEERELVPESVVEQIRRVEGVARAGGDVTGYAQMIAPAGKAVTPSGAPTIGVTYNELLEGGPLTVAQGRVPRGLGEMAMDAGTFDKYEFKIGDKVRVLFQGPPREFSLVGVMKFGGTNSLAGATLAVFDLPTAQRAMDKVGGYDGVIVQVEDGADRAVVRDRIEKILPAGTEVVTGNTLAEEDEEGVGEFLGVFRTVLLVFAGVALFVGAFIIVNTFTILVAQRTRELALLRALGASRGQVIRSVLLEALVVGGFASAVGLGLGFLVALGIQGLFKAVGIDLPATGTVFRARTAVVAFAVGIVVTVVASLLPARRAASVPPVAAMRDETWVPAQAGLRLRALLGLVLLAGGVAFLTIGLVGDTGNALSFVGLGAALLFLGVAVISPLLARRLARWIGAPFAAWRGVPGRLGRENAMRNPRRTAATSAALMVGLALIGTVSVLAESVKASAGDVIDRSLGADFILQTDNFVLHPPALAAALRTRTEFSAVGEARFGQAFKAENNEAALTGMDAAAVRTLMKLRVVDGSLDSLDRGDILLDEDAAKERGVKAGDSLDVEFARTGEKSLRVGGVYETNELIGPYLVSVRTFDANFTVRLNIVTLVNARPGVSPTAARAAINAELTAFPNVTARDQTEVKAEQRKQINQLLGIIYALLALAILIAFFGIVNTLALSVYERVRELGLLRAVGMTRPQVRRMIRYEAVVIAVLGATLGLAVGVILGSALVTALKDEGITRLAYPVPLLLVFLLLAGLSGVIAAALPARRAARINVLEAIAHA